MKTAGGSSTKRKSSVPPRASAGPSPVAVADHLDGPYETIGDPIAPTITEGPCVSADPVGKGWLLYYDYCMVDGYGLAHSHDLVNWDPLAVWSFPEGARHGSIAALKPDDLPILHQLGLPA